VNYFPCMAPSKVPHATDRKKVTDKWEINRLALIFNIPNVAAEPITAEIEQSTSLWFGIETVIPRAGDMYNGANPDTVSLTLWIVDNNDNVYEMSAAAPFVLTRE
jgi:hypothetical protein